jgi:hypothetical protein
MATTVSESAISEVSTQVLRYFREFLDSDFKRLQTPRRRIQLKTKEGFRTGIDLRKYSALFRDAWGLLAKPSQEMVLKFRRNSYRAQISPILRNLVQQFVDQMPEQGLEDVRQSVLRQAKAKRHEGAANPEVYIEGILAFFQERTAKEIVLPMLTLLEGPFKENAYSAEDSIFEVEADLTEMLCANALVHMPEALNTVLLTGNDAPLSGVMAEFFATQSTRAQVVEFFELFAAADAFQELRDVLNYVGSDDQLTTYFYFGAIKFGPNDYPLFYIPVTVKADSEGSGYVLSLDPRLYIHKAAIEYIVGEMRSQSERVSVAIIPERIIHLSETETAQARIERAMKDLSRTFDVAAQLDFHEHKPQIARSPQLRMSNAAYFSAFDRSDESLVNDYEALLSSIDADHKEAHEMFNGIVKSMLFEDPLSVTASVREDWAAMTPAQHLVTSSPIPLNEEQIRIDNARKKPGCRFIAVEGPPGTGKSHTITALAFNAIMDHQTVLIVSDKNEALDVVQDKLTQALLSIRHGEDFPNPILRLGKDGTYRSLINGSARVRIQNHHAAQASNMPALEKELTEKTQALSSSIGKAVSVMSNVEMAKVAKLHDLEISLEAASPGLCPILAKIIKTGATTRLSTHFSTWTSDQRLEFSVIETDSQSINDLVSRARLSTLASNVRSKMTAKDVEALSLFQPMPAANVQVLMKYVTKIEALKMPILGFLFRGGALAVIDSAITDDLPVANPVGISRKLNDIKSVVSTLGMIRAKAAEIELADQYTTAAYQSIQAGVDSKVGPDALPVIVELQKLLMLEPEAVVRLESARSEPLASLAIQAAEYLLLAHQLKVYFNDMPAINFVSDKARLETLNTARLAHRLDSRFLDFAENNRATAQALGGVIKQRAQFPVDQFKTLRDAFPCVIAGIRELGEFVPLKTGVFDLLIIDEGSQVSVAQAMPAMLRAKQVVIFGDRRQFSNVKSHQASKVTNSGYMSALQDHFRQNVTSAVDKIDRLQRFDVKRSVLDFVSLVANHAEMLRKHFRGYPELISYSSKNFYGGALQAIKIRPVPLEDVIQFEVLKHDGRAESKRNTNSVEAEHIIKILVEMAELDVSPTAAIITPHTEQVALISGMVSRHAMGQIFEEKLRLKVFSFDTCQGEERDMIIYSMVATRERDVLNFIFPVSLSDNEDENDNLKAQRLNVGFSRAKEGMIFVLSKEPEEYKGTLGQALMHYKRLLESKNIAEESDTDQSSPMEKKLLNWLKATPFFQVHADQIELIAQFPVGDYLKQLDPTYKHPAYKTDFLLRFMGSEVSNLIIEYDGFEHHFVSREKVNAATFERYYKPEDVERQFVLESYGYRFLRVNRFNLGDDPVATLDKCLNEMIGTGVSDDDSTGSESVDRIKAQAQALDNKDAKQCSRCKTVKDVAGFFDKNLGGGAGGYGRVCMECKAPNVKEQTASLSTGTQGAYRNRRYGGYRRRW